MNNYLVRNLHLNLTVDTPVGRVKELFQQFMQKFFTTSRVNAHWHTMFEDSHPCTIPYRFVCVDSSQWSNRSCRHIVHLNLNHLWILIFWQNGSDYCSSELTNFREIMCYNNNSLIRIIIVTQMIIKTTCHISTLIAIFNSSSFPICTCDILILRSWCVCVTVSKKITST